jgi:CubicO group peptidase (beta-lactamase class C family)
VTRIRSSGHRTRHRALALLLALLCGCTAPGRFARPAPPAGEWKSASPAALGLSSAALREHQTLCERSGADACLVAFRGQIVQEWYGPGYAEPMPTMSSVKSWTALLAMLLAEEGRLDLDAPAARYAPQWTAGAEAGVTVRQLLTMTAGLRRRFGQEPGPDQSIGYVADKNAFVLSLPLDFAPGTRWEYSNEGAQLLSPILESAAGMPLHQYARERLFAPLAMHGTSLRLDEAGHAWTYADAKTSLRDFATICQLMLNRGRWAGRQVLTDSAIRALITPTHLNPQYAMLWWLTPDPSGYATMGYLDTNCFAFPSLDLVVARMQAAPKTSAAVPYVSPGTFRLFRRIVEPASPASPGGR